MEAMSDVEISFTPKEITENKDPLDDIDLETRYYKLNETVFAEPLEIVSNNEIDAETDTEILFLDNVVVHKRPGKRHKYFIEVEENSTKLSCPQTTCSKTFATMTLLRAHVRRVHAAERGRFVCEHCAAAFSARYLLERHRAVHGAARVECPECGKSLSRRTSLSQHLRTHGSARPYPCPQCGRAFARRATLAAHARDVHARTAPQCSRCRHSFPTRKLLTHHYKSCQAK